jgi:hypothetical protein
MDSWYNMSHVEKIIGRGGRNMSHCSLLFDERNVEIYGMWSCMEINFDWYINGR